MQTENIKDENQLTISESKHKFFMEFKSLILPHVSELMTELLLKGSSEEAVLAAVKTAARGYSTFYMALMNHEGTQ